MENTAHKLWFYCFNLIVFISITASATAVSADDPYTEALLSLKSELTDDSDSLKDWFFSSGDPGKLACCSWSGVKCNQNSTSVVALNLSGKNLGGILWGKQFAVFTELIDLNISDNAFSGEFPGDIFNLGSLRSLDISRNNFSGHFPGGVSGLENLVVLDAFSNSFSGPLPIELSDMENLKVLNLAGSYFSGSIPRAYGSFKSLEFLHLGGNLLSGNIPEELGLVRTVTHMEIGYNSYEGVIPWKLGNMTELKYLDIAGANLSGSIPKFFSNLTKLESLFLFRNQLSGPVPWELGHITSLVNLDLSDNQLTGPIPESFAELKNLKLLSLMYNEMTGAVPEGIARLPELDTLFIWNNYFSGSLPRSLGLNSKLRWVDVSTNGFVGSIPEGICSRGALFKLMLFSNNFTGSLSPSLSNCSTLVRIRLEDNSFSGLIPFRFRHFHDLSYIDLSRNNLTGGIPRDISEATKLEYFNISNNPGLGGVIPPEIWSMQNLRNFSASSCNISGHLPEFRSCKPVSVIELSKNSISGTLSGSVSTCQALQKIDLAGNTMTGHIPKELARLPRLRVLDLSHNNFSGSIPSYRLFQTMGEGAYVGNAELCGAPLKQCPASMTMFRGKNTKKIMPVLVSCLVSILVMVVALLVLLYVRHRSRGHWKMISFAGLPCFTADDFLRSSNSPEHSETVSELSRASVFKAVLPTGITVTVKRIEWKARNIGFLLKVIKQMGNARHKNLIRLLGVCYNNHVAYVLYDNLPNGNMAEKIRTRRDWGTKFKIIIGIAKGLCFLHHECYPAIPHGDLKSSNVFFDENMEPRLGEFGFKYVVQLSKVSAFSKLSTRNTDQMNETTRTELKADVYSFGELVFEILTNGRPMNGGEVTHRKPKDDLLREICEENGVGPRDSTQGEAKRVVEVAILCTRSNPSDRPSMEDAVKLLSGPGSRRI
ncbi:PREDICTED: leucine-rich repeat receptor-like protein kinase TDR [Tarenaya hassleriana]|uniref:leucine-rich repeat receptor-like protein kinase TDR n=1 Tax=Tarenaya hassleriana TaxID=28532 RepID=UPI00053C2E60|nr:PREDICTED: leucine-rich repeat receptor-like protein kinase TDR [Tarenaya hassleriana]